MKISTQPIYINLNKISEENLTTAYYIKSTIKFKTKLYKMKDDKIILSSYDL